MQGACCALVFKMGKLQRLASKDCQTVDNTLRDLRMCLSNMECLYLILLLQQAAGLLDPPAQDQACRPAPVRQPLQSRLRPKRRAATRCLGAAPRRKGTACRMAPAAAPLQALPAAARPPPPQMEAWSHAAHLALVPLAAAGLEEVMLHS